MRLAKLLCLLGGHRPAPHAVLLVGRALTRCQRCRAALLSDGGPWEPFQSPYRKNVDALLDVLARDALGGQTGAAPAPAPKA